MAGAAVKTANVAKIAKAGMRISNLLAYRTSWHQRIEADKPC
jgi:hypothetical protein